MFTKSAWLLLYMIVMRLEAYKMDFVIHAQKTGRELGELGALKEQEAYGTPS